MTSTTVKKTSRGTSNGNAAGSSEARRRRRAWLLETYRANVDAWVYIDREIVSVVEPGTILWHLSTSNRSFVFHEAVPACRCYRCGKLLIVDTLTVDRIIPGCRGGTYRRNNIRPACSNCNSSTGGATRRKKR